MKPIFLHALLIVATATLAGCDQTGRTEGPAGSDNESTSSQQLAEYAPIPESILTPNSVDTRVGTLEFFDGLPSEDTVQQAYDNLDFQRGVRAFLDGIPLASLHAMKEGLLEAGSTGDTIGIWENLMDSRTLFLTGNTESVYVFYWLDLRDGPVVIESPPNTLGIADDAFFNHVTDMGNAGPDRGQGGKYLFVPPGWEGELPEGYYTNQSPTFGNWVLWRGFLVDGDPRPAVDSIKATLKIYPLAQAENPPQQKFINLSGKTFNTIHANDFEFYQEVAQVIQDEPIESLDPEFLGLLAAIGIEKGQPFAPDARMKAILTDAVAVANATARSILFKSRKPEIFPYEDRSWFMGFIGGDHRFQPEGAKLLDVRTLFHYYATGITPAMSMKMVGVGSQYMAATLDNNGDAFDGGRAYRLNIPADVPAKDFWSLVVYDNQTRSMLQTDQQLPSLNSQGRGLVQNADGSTDVYFAPEAPAGKESNWIQTVPGKGWSVIFRLYGPLEPFFDRTWKPGNVDLMADVPAIEASGTAPKMATDIPVGITTPDRIETRIGTLEFVDGVPTDETVELVFNNLDFMRGMETFLNFIPAASLHALLEGMKEVGAERNGDMMVTDYQVMDSRSLFLTANNETVYGSAVLDLEDGPVVMETPPNVLGVVNDHFFRYVADLGNAGPDKGQGGKFLFLPPDWGGDTPEGYFTYRSSTYRNWVIWRGFLVDGDPGPASQANREHMRIYPLAHPEQRDDARFINMAGKYYNTIHANNFEFYREIDEVIQEEPASAFSPEILGLLAAIGIEKGKPFKPDARMEKILTEAVAVGNATARSIVFRARDPRAYIFEGQPLFNPFVGGDYQFLKPSGARDLDARTLFHYPFTVVTPAMAMKLVGAGSQYGILAIDSDGNYLDGGKTYRITLPKGIPAKDFWSFCLYDPQTRSMLQVPGNTFPSLSDAADDPVPNEDGSITIWFGPQAPEGKEDNWVETVPGKGWFTAFRLYGPLDPWFDQTWQPGEVELVKD